MEVCHSYVEMSSEVCVVWLTEEIRREPTPPWEIAEVAAIPTC